MNLESRKIEFVKEFLNLQNEEVVSRLEKILKKEKISVTGKQFTPMTQKELDQRIDQSESDFQKNNFKSSAELLAKYQ
jgi:hypothetical protein